MHNPVLLRKNNFYLFSWNLKLHGGKKLNWWTYRNPKTSKQNKIPNCRLCWIQLIPTWSHSSLFQIMAHIGKEIVQFSGFLESKRHFLGAVQISGVLWRVQDISMTSTFPVGQVEQILPSYDKEVLRSSLRMVTTATNFDSEDEAARKSKMLGADSLKTTRTVNKIKGHNLRRNIKKLLFCWNIFSSVWWREVVKCPYG